MTPSTKTARRWIGRAFALIGVATCIVLFTPLASWWAHAYSGPIEEPTGDVLILLNAAADDGGEISYSSFWRARYAVHAWRDGTFKTLVVSGNEPSVLEFLVASGVPRNAIVAEMRSTTTRENGVETAKLVGGMSGRKVLLTSDFHVYRATRVFRKLGIEVAPMPIPDAIKRGSNWRGRCSAFEDLVLETVKIGYYRYKRWI